MLFKSFLLFLGATACMLKVFSCHGAPGACCFCLHWAVFASDGTGLLAMQVPKGPSPKRSSPGFSSMAGRGYRPGCSGQGIDVRTATAACQRPGMWLVVRGWWVTSDIGAKTFMIIIMIITHIIYGVHISIQTCMVYDRFWSYQSLPLIQVIFQLSLEGWALFYSPQQLLERCECSKSIETIGGIWPGICLWVPYIS